eukprot:3701729-Pyramimonas_sp.AAC.1
MVSALRLVGPPAICSVSSKTDTSRVATNATSSRLPKKGAVSLAKGTPVKDCSHSKVIIIKMPSSRLTYSPLSVAGSNQLISLQQHRRSLVSARASWGQDDEGLPDIVPEEEPAMKLAPPGSICCERCDGD